MDTPKKETGFAIRTWSDIGVLVLLITFILSGLVWGMKLEARYDKVESNQSDLMRQIGSGILPRSDERIRSHDREIQELKRELEMLNKRLSEHGANGSTHRMDK